jgi:hypothetical protein
MLPKTALGSIVAAALDGGMPTARAQSTTCAYPWCVNQVVIGPKGAALEWGEIRMARKLPDATILWTRYGGPDDEFRIDSVVLTGTNAAGSAVQFPARRR